MPEMRRPWWSADGLRRGVIAWVVGSFVVLVAIAVPATASSIATPEPTVPVPARTIATVPGSPFDDVVGGARLGTAGVPVVPAGVAPPQGVDATAWLIADAESGDVLGGFNPHEGQLPASTIKLLTALALLPHIDADATYTVTDVDITVDGSRVGLVPGQRYTRADLVHGLLLASGNDAANALAQLAGGQARALGLMSEEARRLGAFDTTVRTTHGLDEPGQRTSPYDLALIGRAALENKEIATVARTQIYDFPGLKGRTFQIQNRNRLLGSYPGAIGLKTGFTTLSGHTLVAAAERGGVRLVAVVLGGKGRPEPTASALLDWGFALPQGIEPVGRLVTRSEVAAALKERENTSSPPAAGEQDATLSVGAEPEPDASEPEWALPAIVGGAFVGVAVVAVAAVTRRRRRIPPISRS
jgi:D-alanyl-D-alanine carboxypeptidase (penicillin-binding protein 5/6)